MKKWYVNFRTRTGHTNTYWVEAKTLGEALSTAVTDYARLHTISPVEAMSCATDAGER